MRFRSLRLFLVLALGMACLFGCSRESSIKENVNLRNNHSVVFAFNKPFENAEAFADSIINLSNPDSVLVYDTLTITVNDTVYLMGFLRYNSDKVYRYIWHFEEPYSKDNKDTLFSVNNVDITISVCNEDLNAYINSLDRTVMGGQETPTFSNVDGGVGIFASRRNHITVNIPADSFGNPTNLPQRLVDLGVGFYGNF